MEIDADIRATFKELTADLSLDDLFILWTDVSAFRFLLRELILKEMDNAH